MPSVTHAAVWAVGGATVTAMLTRPRGVPEWCWALAGAVVLLIAGLVPADVAEHAVADGWNVYLFLAGIIVLAELARIEGVFDWLASLTVPAAGGSTVKLFACLYLVGIAVTALLSNDATVLLLTPAVLAIVRRAGAPVLPFVFACAFVANAASFVLPISNPANLLVFRHLPSLGAWLSTFGLASVLAIVCTYGALYVLHRRGLRRRHDVDKDSVVLTPAGRLTAAAVGVSALLLIVSAALGWPVGIAACIVGALSLMLVSGRDGAAPRAVMRESPWSIIPLVAGLFVIVAALDRSGALPAVHRFFQVSGTMVQPVGKLVAGTAVTIADNFFNNLPGGVLARYTVHFPDVPAPIAHSVLVAVDLGPNVSVTGSLATLLWIVALRREGIVVTPLQFLRAGIFVTLPSLLVALLAVS